MSYVQRVVTATLSCLRRMRNIKPQLAHVARLTPTLVLLGSRGKEFPLQFYLQDRYRTFAL
jgi:hypothetical protein